jgi:hypothetical protein
MEVSFRLVAQPAGSKNKTPPVCAGGVWGSVLLCLPDPRRRVRNDAYYDYAYDDRFHCKGSGRAEGTECVHADFQGMGEKQFENYELADQQNQASGRQLCQRAGNIDLHAPILTWMVPRRLHFKSVLAKFKYLK